MIGCVGELSDRVRLEAARSRETRTICQSHPGNFPRRMRQYDCSAIRSVHTSTRIDVAIVVVVIAGKVSSEPKEVGNALDAGIDAEEGIGGRGRRRGAKER